MDILKSLYFSQDYFWGFKIIVQANKFFISELYSQKYKDGHLFQNGRHKVADVGRVGRVKHFGHH